MEHHLELLQVSYVSKHGWKHSSMEEGALIVDARVTWTTLKAFTCSDVHKPTWRPAPTKELLILILMAACMKIYTHLALLGWVIWSAVIILSRNLLILQMDLHDHKHAHMHAHKVRFEL